MIIAGILLYYFYRSIHSGNYHSAEGLQQTGIHGKNWGLLLATFLLTVIYLPLSTLSIHVLVWSEELWAVPNPYTNSTVFPPIVAPLGPPAEFRDPLDFCWTTTMKRNEVNFAPISIILSSIALITVSPRYTWARNPLMNDQHQLTIWYPIALGRVIRQSVPKVDRFTELGRPRNQVEMDAEYQRLLNRDPSPFSFLYHGKVMPIAEFFSSNISTRLSSRLGYIRVNLSGCKAHDSLNHRRY